MNGHDGTHNTAYSHSRNEFEPTMKQLSSYVMEIAENECVTCVTSLRFLYWCGVQCVTVTYLSRGRPLYVKDQ